MLDFSFMNVIKIFIANRSTLRVWRNKNQLIFMVLILSYGYYYCFFFCMCVLFRWVFNIKWFLSYLRKIFFQEQKKTNKDKYIRMRDFVNNFHQWKSFCMCLWWLLLLFMHEKKEDEENWRRKNTKRFMIFSLNFLFWIIFSSY
jgi:hypothetical protein